MDEVQKYNSFKKCKDGAVNVTGGKPISTLQKKRFRRRVNKNLRNMNFYKCAILSVTNEIYFTEDERPTVKFLLPVVKDEINFTVVRGLCGLLSKY
jgi:hypothetical protein